MTLSICASNPTYFFRSSALRSNELTLSECEKILPFMRYWIFGLGEHLKATKYSDIVNTSRGDCASVSSILEVTSAISAMNEAGAWDTLADLRDKINSAFVVKSKMQVVQNDLKNNWVSENSANPPLVVFEKNGNSFPSSLSFDRVPSAEIECDPTTDGHEKSATLFQVMIPWNSSRYEPNSDSKVDSYSNCGSKDGPKFEKSFESKNRASALDSPASSVDVSSETQPTPVVAATAINTNPDADADAATIDDISVEVVDGFARVTAKTSAIDNAVTSSTKVGRKRNIDDRSKENTTATATTTKRDSYDRIESSRFRSFAPPGKYALTRSYNVGRTDGALRRSESTFSGNPRFSDYPSRYSPPPSSSFQPVRHSRFRPGPPYKSSGWATACDSYRTPISADAVDDDEFRYVFKPNVTEQRQRQWPRNGPDGGPRAIDHRHHHRPRSYVIQHHSVSEYDHRGATPYKHSSRGDTFIESDETSVSRPRHYRGRDYSDRRPKSPIGNERSSKTLTSSTSTEKTKVPSRNTDDRFPRCRYGEGKQSDEAVRIAPNRPFEANGAPFKSSEAKRISETELGGPSGDPLPPPTERDAANRFENIDKFDEVEEVDEYAEDWENSTKAPICDGSRMLIEKGNPTDRSTEDVAEYFYTDSSEESSSEDDGDDIYVGDASDLV